MLNNRIKRLSSLLLALGLVLSLAAPAVLAAEEAENTVCIASIPDLVEFAKSCSLDTWSQGKTVILEKDLNLEGVEFTPIPTFGGLFLGQGHTISGLRVTAAGSTMGLFRYIQPQGAVENLHVQGMVSPAGTRSTVGGIAGDNAGIIRSCSFRGTVQGESAVGGIAGRNSETGQIVDCTAAGSVSGENATGGIAGRNAGILLKCQNSAGVNLNQSGESPAGLDAAALLEERGDEESYHLLTSCSDTGGVAGWSAGIIQSCQNSGDVGYPHVGYNTGGVVGRSSGYLSQCGNSGTVLGRKDVGGIVGQAEPYVLADPGRDVIEELRRELNTLEGLINRSLDDAERTGNDASARLSLMGDYTTDAKDSTKEMLDRLSDFTDETVGSVNTLLSDVTDALDRLAPALDDLSDAGARLERLSRQLKSAMEDLDDAVEIGEDILAQIRAALDDLERAGNRLSGASGDLKDALDDLLQGLLSGDQEAAGGAAEEADRALDAIGGAFSHAADAAGDLRDALGGTEDLAEGILPSLDDSVRALDDIAGAVGAIPPLPGLSLSDLKSSSLDELLEKLVQAGRDLDTALSAIQKALGGSDALSGKLKDALRDLQSAAGSSAAIGRLLHRAFDTAGDAVRRLTGDGPVEFTPLGEDFRQASDSLYTAMGGLFDEMEGLNSLLRDANGTLTADLRAVNRQCNVVFTLLSDALTDAMDDAEAGLDAVIEDTSEEDIAATREGKVDQCRNSGRVEGDRNVGGVVGAMAIEFDLDPEDDGAGRFSFGSTYETKAVLQDCVNYGAVTAKKDCVGGLAGRMDLGTAIGCQSYGPVESTGGDYAGGVAGFADASVRECFSKCILSGKNYVGGIAGWASRIQGCYAIATINQGTECVGAIAGGVEEAGVLRDNRFVDTGWAGLDGVSYAGRAEPISFEALSALPDIPPEFTSFLLTFLAEGEVEMRIPFLYGEDLSQIPLPPVPPVQGSYGFWPEFDTSGTCSDITVEAEYAPWVTVVASAERSGKLSLALAEGQFTGQACLQVTSSAQTPPPGAEEDWVLWDVSLTGTDTDGADSIPLRLLNTVGKGAVLYQYREGSWQEVEAEENGQYLLLTMEGTSGTFCLKPGSSSLTPILLIGLGMAVLAALTALLLRRRKRRAAAKPAAKV